MKHCAKCDLFKPFTDFNKSAARKDGHNPYCKSCCKEYRTQNRDAILAQKKEWYMANTDLAKQRMRDRYHNNSEKHRKAIIEYYSQPENRAKRLLSKIKARATKSNIPFNLELIDIIIPTHCPYLGIELTHDLGKGFLDSNSSVDRIIPELGYIKGNIQIISRLANQMKNSATKDQLITFAKNVLAMEKQ